MEKISWKLCSEQDKCEAEIRSQVAREIVKSVEFHYDEGDTQPCPECDHIDCSAYIFTKDCSWWQSLKKEYGIEE